MNNGIEAAREDGHDAIILVGDDAYYSRAGFSRITPGRIRFCGPVDARRILGLALKPGALDSLTGEVMRAQIDTPVCADAARLG
jgi:predicted N-acetyltransferase YhbS